MDFLILTIEYEEEIDIRCPLKVAVNHIPIVGLVPILSNNINDSVAFEILENETDDIFTFTLSQCFSPDFDCTFPPIEHHFIPCSAPKTKTTRVNNISFYLPQAICDHHSIESFPVNIAVELFEKYLQGFLLIGLLLSITVLTRRFARCFQESHLAAVAMDTKQKLGPAAQPNETPHNDINDEDDEYQSGLNPAQKSLKGRQLVVAVAVRSPTPLTSQPTSESGLLQAPTTLPSLGPTSLRLHLLCQEEFDIAVECIPSENLLGKTKVTIFPISLFAPVLFLSAILAVDQVQTMRRGWSSLKLSTLQPRHWMAPTAA